MPVIDRRRLLAGGIGLGGAAVLGAAARGAVPPAEEVLYLWPGQPPGSPAVLPVESIVERSSDPALPDRAVTGVGTPTLTVFRPVRPNGAALLVVPGGVYARVVLDKEGIETARLAAEAGYTALLLRYRLPAEGWANRAEVPLQDAQRAMRLIRAGAPKFGISPGRVGVIGYSAGGHLAATLATRWDAATYAAVDTADSLSARPDAVALVYPVVALSGPHLHKASRDNLLGPTAAETEAEARSPHRAVSAAMPPCFLLHAVDDASVLVENSLMLHAALRGAGVPAELHIYPDGGHGFGIIRARGKSPARWTVPFLDFLERRLPR